MKDYDLGGSLEDGEDYTGADEYSVSEDAVFDTGNTTTDTGVELTKF